METPKTALLGRTLDEIQQIVRNLGMPKFAAKQITSWLYDKKVETIDEMTNLSLKHREALKEGYEVGASAPVEEMRSVDGTVKYLFRTLAHNFIEAVYIPDEDRATLCVSSQVGCKMNCKFCMTGKQGLRFPQGNTTPYLDFSLAWYALPIERLFVPEVALRVGACGA